jgi:hypothetical protein
MGAADRWVEDRDTNTATAPGTTVFPGAGGLKSSPTFLWQLLGEGGEGEADFLFQ